MRAVTSAGASVVHLEDPAAVAGVDAVIWPSPITAAERPSQAVVDALVGAAEAGLPVLGIDGGFDALCRAGLLPGRLEPNEGGHFVCRDQPLRVETRDTIWTCALSAGDTVTFVHASHAGRYTADPDVLDRLEADQQVVLRYLGENPNGSANAIAGITNARGNVVGLVPRPEDAIDLLTGPSADGRRLFDSLLAFVQVRG
ncbi:MAG: phosphoribosylformylglycinamidine synthase subunit PurQ [Propionibacteriaceae bacterium]|nr:phosphoribosylformylglycinamidine synthase subunit PurQ [Propionibacteriaceae bacterium]